MKLFAKKQPRCCAVIVAAGSASRMGGIDKVMAPIGGVPMILRTAQVFDACDAIDEIIIVTRKDLLEPINDLCRDCAKLSAVVCGGETRTDSVMAGLTALAERCQLVAVHDGARPLVTAQIIRDTVERARKTYAAAPAVAVKDTIKIADDGKILSTPDRSHLFAVQTPQVFDYDLLCAALTAARQNKLPLTDECAAVEQLGKTVYLTEGSYENIKVTTPVDLAVAEAILQWRKQA